MDIRVIRGSELTEAQLENLVRDFIAIRDEEFPETMKQGYADGEVYFRQQIIDPQNIVVCGFDENGKVVTYVAAVPHQSLYDELKEHDYHLEDDPNSETYYIENVASIAGSFRFTKKVIDELVREVDRRGRKQITMHVRVLNNLSHAICSFYPMQIIRTIPWWPYDEPAHYLVNYVSDIKWLQKEKEAA